MSDATIEITDASFEQEVLKAAGGVVVDFWAPWCGPCRVVGPILDELAGQFAGKVKIAKLNVDENSQVAGKFNVMNIPTLILFKDGKEEGRAIGVQSKEELQRKIQALL
ncbi:MAG: thioredoxin [Candidatus Omnitrophica bacterium]|nr:thioredoxin [Candidatus Omnitrophota bacterium]